MTDNKLTPSVNDLARRLLVKLQWQGGTPSPPNWQTEPGLTDDELAFLAEAWTEAANYQALITHHMDEFSDENLAAINGYIAGIRWSMNLARRKFRRKQK